MKKTGLIALVMALVLMFGCVGAAHAEIIPAYGFGQIGLQSVVLCEKLTLRESPSGTAKAILTMEYGDLPIVVEQIDGWARVVTGDAEDSPSGWVNSDYIVIDPAWYRTEGKTAVYAWNSTSALKVALLDKGTRLPILKDENGWLLVSLRGAVGWIRK